MVKDPLANAGDDASIPGSGKIHWRRKWQLTPAFLPGKSHGKRSLVGYSPWGHKRVGHDRAHTQYNNRSFWEEKWVCVCGGRDMLECECEWRDWGVV